MAKNVVVVGSLSVDFVMRVPRRPEKGETLTGFDFNTFVGGKGNNQALAAARAGAEVHMVGCVGEDSYGTTLANKLSASGVNIDNLVRRSDVGTGIANIYVDPQGDNSIVIIPQANATLNDEVLSAASATIRGAGILMLQLECPLESSTKAAQIAHANGVQVMLNPAPAPPSGDLPADLWKSIDLLVPNQTEAEILTGIKCADISSAEKAARALQAKGAKEVILTLGEDGALILDRNGATTHVPAFKVTPTDTTAAGDAFCGACAASLANGASLQEAVRVGCAAGGLATMKAGAEPSLPTRDEIEKLMADQMQTAR
jgi:ribokinase